MAPSATDPRGTRPLFSRETPEPSASIVLRVRGQESQLPSAEGL